MKIFEIPIDYFLQSMLIHFFKNLVILQNTAAD